MVLFVAQTEDRGKGIGGGNYFLRISEIAAGVSV